MKMKMKRILVTGAGGSAGHNFINSLRLAYESFYVVGGDANRWHLELSNADYTYLIPPANEVAGYIEALNKIIKKEKIEFVHPQPDIEVAVISEKRDEIDALTYLPDKKTIRICQNKMKLNEVLKKNGVAVPASFLILKEKDLKKAVPHLLERFPEKVWLRAIKGAGARASLPVRKVSQAEMWINYWDNFKGIGYGDFMMSEYLPGGEFAFQSLWKNGELITSQARERLEYVFGYLTPSGQTSSPAVARTVHRDDVNKVATDAVLAVDPGATGVFCVDLKENSAGVPCVTEINAGRFFTTSNFFSKAGANMPYYYVKLAYKEKIPELKKYNSVSEDLYWIRIMDMGYTLVKGERWKCKKI